MPETNTTLERPIDLGAIDLETGEFPLVLATQREATDGNVLNIRGAIIADSVPLQVNHANSPLQTIGEPPGFAGDSIPCGAMARRTSRPK